MRRQREMGHAAPACAAQDPHLRTIGGSRIREHIEPVGRKGHGPYSRSRWRNHTIPDEALRRMPLGVSAKSPSDGAFLLHALLRLVTCFHGPIHIFVGVAPNVTGIRP